MNTSTDYEILNLFGNKNNKHNKDNKHNKHNKDNKDKKDNKSIKKRLKRFSKNNFKLLKNILSAPSPVGFEASMTYGILMPELLKFPNIWKKHTFKSSASVVLEKPSIDKKNELSIMFIGHADKVRMQVKSISEKGKIFIYCDSILPSALLGHKVIILVGSLDNKLKKIKGVVQGLGAIHYLDKDYEDGNKSVTENDVYIELGILSRKKVKKMGIKVGDPIIFDNEISHNFGSGGFSGAYLDNGIGCYVVLDLAKKVSKIINIFNKLGFHKFKSLRLLFAFVSFEEINRFGSRVIANIFKPDVIIAIDACHDYKHAPGIEEHNYPEISINKGYCIYTGSITSPLLNNLLKKGSKLVNVKYQIDTTTDDTGTDAMASVFSNLDSVTGSIGIPVSYMHTISEMASTNDINSAIYGLYGLLEIIERNKITNEYFKKHLNYSF